ncbi:MAG: leucine-rich repeat domain-containing protein [Candidatus Lokiarchaeota archaeon]|nr:leucine-rich repeat domain-containing protein [Candidatus Lokiarchaeota archaeon]
MLEFQKYGIFAFVFVIFFLAIRQIPLKKEFTINQYLKLKLEGGRTNIYVNNRRFMQCMYLLLNISTDRIEEYDEIESIDEAAVKLNRSMERNHGKVPPETEFWGHCSNIQTWAENNYDTRILHRNLAFPLLKALVDAGDPIAKRKFKEEIALRYATGHPTVIRFLTQNGYLHYLTEDEFESMLLDINFPSIDEYCRNVIPKLNNTLNPESIKIIKQQTSSFINRFRFKYKYLILLKAIEKIPEIKRQDFVEIIYNKYKSVRSFPILKFLSKAKINFYNLDLKIITYNDRLIGLILDSKINLKNRMIEKIEDIKGFEENSENIEELDLSSNRINKITKLDNLTKLKKLYLKNNYIENIEGIKELNNLEVLDLSGNINIEEIPDFLNRLPNLKTVKLTGCRITKFSNSVSRFFWMGQNFRNYTNYSDEDIKYYEKTHTSKASNGGRLYKNFVKWLFRLEEIKKEFKFNHKDIKKFEEQSQTTALLSGKPSNAFQRYLFNRNQKKITSFF